MFLTPFLLSSSLCTHSDLLFSIHWCNDTWRGKWVANIAESLSDIPRADRQICKFILLTLTVIVYCYNYVSFPILLANENHHSTGMMPCLCMTYRCFREASTSITYPDDKGRNFISQVSTHLAVCGDIPVHSKLHSHNHNKLESLILTTFWLYLAFQTFKLTAWILEILELQV